MTMIEFLAWLGTSTGAVVAFSFITERLAAFQALSPINKRLVHLLGASLLAVTALLLQTYVVPLIPAETLALLGQVFLIVAGIVGPYFAGQGYHQLDRQNTPPQA